jgi:hypothetical protein
LPACASLTLTNLTGWAGPRGGSTPDLAASEVTDESNARSNERLNAFYTEAPTVGRSIGVSIERLFEL